MKIKYFVEQFLKTPISDNDYITRTYIPYAEKINIVNALIEVMTYEQDGLITYDTNELEMNRDIQFIKAYTALEFEDIFEDYDLLIKNKIIDYLFKDDSSELYLDVERLNDMLDNQLYDLKRDNNTLEVVVNRNLGLIVDSATSAIDGLNDKISETDTKKLTSAITKGFKGIVELLNKQGK